MSARGLAQLGESLRLTGNYSGAVDCFTAAIQRSKEKTNRNYSWALAHRAAARAGLGDYSRAVKDFIDARDYYLKHGLGWLLSQVGELCRLWARACITVPGTEAPHPDELKALREFQRHFNLPEVNETSEGVREYIGQDDAPPTIKHMFILLEMSIQFFGSAWDKREDDPWTHAHLAATHAMRCALGLPSQRLAGTGWLKKDYDAADKHFQHACTLNPAYGWAFAFHAILRGLNDTQEAVRLIGNAYMTGMDRQVPLTRTLTNFALINLSRSKTKDTEARLKEEEAAVQYAWTLLQAETDEVYARYYVADALELIEGEPSKEGNLCPAIARARVEVFSMRGRALAMQGGLACMERNYAEAAQVLQELLDLRTKTTADPKASLMADPNTLSMISSDPSWRRVRDPGDDDAPDLRKAHGLYLQLFNF
jgi:tetratricopeptide (TPR) repeat protein